MRRSLFVAISILFLSILTLASPAHAQLVNGTSSSGDTVIDTVNNMEWLDVSETIGLTPTTALAIHADAGWTWATAAGQIIRIDVGDGRIRLGGNSGTYADIGHPEINANKHRLYIDTAFKYGAASFGEFIFWNK